MRSRLLAGAVLGLLAAAVPVALGEAQTKAPAENTAPKAGATAEFPVDWFFMADKPDLQAKLRRMDGKPAPELKVGAWLNGEPTTMEAMRGNIVVVDFWGTWCAPCLRAFPHTRELAKEYKSKGVEFIAICDDSKAPERAPSIVKKYALNFRVAMDDKQGSYKAFLGQWYPFYVLVDREGVIRASGLRPDTIQLAIDALLVEQPFDPDAQPAEKTEAGSTDHQSSAAPLGPRTVWLEGTFAQRAKLDGLEGNPATELDVVAATWQNADPIDLASLKGSVVLLDFWGTWCGPCLQSVPKVNAIAEKYADDGLVVIGVCHSRNSQTMPAVAAKHSIAYPIVADTAGATFKAYRVDGTPDYYLIDRQGNVRFADVANDHIEEAIRFLLAEQVTAATD